MHLRILTTKQAGEDQQEVLFGSTIENSMKGRENVEKEDSPTPEEEGHAGLVGSTNLRSFAHSLPEKIKSFFISLL